MSITNAEIVEALSTKSLMEVVELISLIESKFGVSAAVQVAASPAADAPAVEEQTEFDVVLTGLSEGTNKVLVIKAVRAATGLGLIESKAMVESVPAVVKSQVSKEEADNLKSQLLEAGGLVEVK